MKVQNISITHNLLIHATMKMIRYTYSTDYLLKWELPDLPGIFISDCKTVIDCINNKIIKKSSNNGTIGYYIKGKFYSQLEVNKMCVLVDVKKVPF